MNTLLKFEDKNFIKQLEKLNYHADLGNMPVCAPLN